MCLSSNPCLPAVHPRPRQQVSPRGQCRPVHLDSAWTALLALPCARACSALHVSPPPQPLQQPDRAEGSRCLPGPLIVLCSSHRTPCLAACTAGVLYVATGRSGGTVRGAICDRYGGGGSYGKAAHLYLQPLHKRPQCVLVAAGVTERALGLCFALDLLP